MEGIASGFAVGSLSIQVAECALKLHRFWEQCHDAPKDIDALVQDLRHLSAGLKNSPPTPELTRFAQPVNLLWESCRRKTDELSEMLQDSESGLTSSSKRRRIWSAFKATLKRPKIKELQDALHDTKQSLVLVRQQLPV